PPPPLVFFCRPLVGSAGPPPPPAPPPHGRPRPPAPLSPPPAQPSTRTPRSPAPLSRSGPGGVVGVVAHASPAPALAAPPPPRPFRPQVADGREARQQGAPQMVRGPADSQGQRFLEHLVIPARFVIRVQQNVRVRVDQSRQQRGPGQLDDAGVGRHLDLAFRA